MSQQPPPDPSEIILSAADINRAGGEGVISQNDADRLTHWAYDQRFKRTPLADRAPSPAPEKPKAFNLVTVLYYFGALLMISACAWFLGDKWDGLGRAESALRQSSTSPSPQARDSGCDSAVTSWRAVSWLPLQLA